ncbi:MAG TPA: FMN-binding negative transcriptional regulator [Steroidobacter sp.]|uniref:FMN-binding negative transcriptional regulator n=1 Tax=Steroidobacter sp. TaxID=1978227 RepID=UPI002EDAD4BB
MSDQQYPPQRHLECDLQRLFGVVERYPLATLISAEGDEAFVTHAPLTLDRTRGAHGVLFGHMDRSNPHSRLLNARAIRAIFHGANAYISPHVYGTSQLPTWNYLIVHASGVAHRLEDNQRVVQGLQGLSEKADRRKTAFRLSAEDPRIPPLINLVVGFEITISTIIGRFKLSQDRSPADRRRAMDELIRNAKSCDESFLRSLLDSQKDST